MYRSDLTDWLVSGVLFVAAAVAVWLGGWLFAVIDGTCIWLWKSYRPRGAPMTRSNNDDDLLAEARQILLFARAVTTLVVVAVVALLLFAITRGGPA